MTEVEVEIGVEHFADYVRSRVLAASLIKTGNTIPASVLAELQRGHYDIVPVNREKSLSLRQNTLMEAFRNSSGTDVEHCGFVHDIALLRLAVANKNTVFKSLYSLVGKVKVRRRAIGIVVCEDNVSDDRKTQVVVRTVIGIL